jgi:hypothetical protein
MDAMDLIFEIETTRSMSTQGKFPEKIYRHQHIHSFHFLFNELNTNIEAIYDLAPNLCADIFRPFNGMGTVLIKMETKNTHKFFTNKIRIQNSRFVIQQN